MKKDDHTIDKNTQKEIRKNADLLLKKADAVGVFPTPIPEIVAAAELEISREAVLDKVFLGGIYRKLPNALKLAPDKIKKAAAKVMGLLDVHDRTIHIDPSVHPAKKGFLTLHEVGHGFLPWQTKIFSVLEDSNSELDPDTRDIFEREANCFASDVIFQLDSFTKEAADSEFSIWTPIKTGKKYGASIYATARRYVTTSSQPCALIVLEPKKGQKVSLRRAVVSPSYREKFGDEKLPLDFGPGDFFYDNLPYKKYSKSDFLTLTDLNGEEWETATECFDSTKNFFYLIRPVRKRVMTAGGIFW